MRSAKRAVCRRECRQAVTRPTMRFVEVKSPDQQSVMVLHRVRMMLMRQRIQLSNAIGGHMEEFGLVAPIGREGLHGLIRLLDEADGRVPEEAATCLPMLAGQLRLVNQQILETDRRIRTSARATEAGRQLMTIPGVDSLLASALVATVADPKAFKSGRNLAAWIGLAPKQNLSGGQGAAGRHHQAGRPIPTPAPSRRRLGRRPLRRAKRDPLALACATAGQANDEGRHRRLGQQDRADGMGNHDQRRELPRAGALRGIDTARWRHRAWKGQ
jgi:transposase